MDWNSLYEDPKFCLREPAEEVVKILPLLQAHKARKILDLGFGAGRHIMYFAKLGFDMYGVDISEKGREITNMWLTQESLKAKLIISDMTIIPYADNFFDVCVCRGTITHNTLDNIRVSIAEIYRTLVPQGIVMCTFISRESSEFRRGHEIEPHTWVPDDGIEEGVPHHFVDRDEVVQLMKDFKIVDVYHMRHSGIIDIGAPYVSAHWVVVGEK